MIDSAAQQRTPEIVSGKQEADEIDKISQFIPEHGMFEEQLL
jgi:hypothetical protein